MLLINWSSKTISLTMKIPENLSLCIPNYKSLFH